MRKNNAGIFVSRPEEIKLVYIPFLHEESSLYKMDKNTIALVVTRLTLYPIHKVL